MAILKPLPTVPTEGTSKTSESSEGVSAMKKILHYNPNKAVGFGHRLRIKNPCEAGRVLTRFTDEFVDITRVLPSRFELRPGEDNSRADFISSISDKLGSPQLGEIENPSQFFIWDITEVNWIEFLDYLEHEIRLPQLPLLDEVLLSHHVTFDWKGQPETEMHNGIGFISLGHRSTIQPHLTFEWTDDEVPFEFIKKVSDHFPFSMKAKYFKRMERTSNRKKFKTSNLKKEEIELFAQKLSIPK